MSSNNDQKPSSSNSSKAPSDANNNIPDRPPTPIPMEEDLPHFVETPRHSAAPMDPESQLIRGMRRLNLAPVKPAKRRERRIPSADYEKPLIRQSPIKFLCRCPAFMDRIAMPPPVSTESLQNQRVLSKKKLQRERREIERERMMNLSPRKLKLKRKRSASEALAALLGCIEMTSCPYCKKKDDYDDDDDMNGGGGGPSVGGGGASRRITFEAKFDFAC